MKKKLSHFYWLLIIFYAYYIKLYLQLKCITYIYNKKKIDNVKQ